MNNKKNAYDSHNPILNSETKDKLPLEAGVLTLISVFAWRFLTVLLATIPILLFLAIAWLFSDYSLFISAIFLGFTSVVFFLLVVSIFRKEASSIDKFLKRLIDISISLLLLFFMSPLMIIVAVLIRIESKGPVFFSQQRLGRDGKLFGKVKYRTMHISNTQFVNAQDNEKFIKLSDGPRITRIGTFLRKTSLDELPQIYNVLRGEMSLVGPRPPLPYEVDRTGGKYLEIIKATPPGITGLWQISLVSDKTIDESIQLDEYYVKNWSLWLDIKILAKTFTSIFRSTGAY